MSRRPYHVADTPEFAKLPKDVREALRFAEDDLRMAIRKLLESSTVGELQTRVADEMPRLILSRLLPFFQQLADLTQMWQQITAELELLRKTSQAASIAALN